MPYTNLSDAVARLDEIEATAAAYSHAMGVLSLDAATAAPLGSAEGRGRTMAVLSNVIYSLAAAPDTRELLEFLTAHAEELDPEHRRQVEIRKKSCDQLIRIPQEEYVAYNVLVNKAEGIWRVAKQQNDFAAFSPILEEIVAYNRKFAGYYDATKLPYDALLNEYEEGLTMETLDAFFAELRKVIVPLVKAISEKEQPDTAFLDQSYPIEQQKLLAKYEGPLALIEQTFANSGAADREQIIAIYTKKFEEYKTDVAKLNSSLNLMAQNGCDDDSIYFVYAKAAYDIQPTFTASIGLVLPSLIVILIVAAMLKRFKDSPLVKKAFYGLRPASTGLIAAAGISVAVSNLFGSAPFSVNWKGWILAAVLWLLTNKVSSTKKLHPIVFIGFSALVGIVFSMG